MNSKNLSASSDDDSTDEDMQETKVKTPNWITDNQFTSEPYVDDEDEEEEDMPRKGSLSSWDNNINKPYQSDESSNDSRARKRKFSSGTNDEDSTKEEEIVDPPYWEHKPSFSFESPKKKKKTVIVGQEASSLNKPITFENKGRKIMEKTMGYKEGEGLGKHSQGRLDPVELSNQKGRRGLGLSFPELEAAITKWDPTEEDLEAKEEFEWLEGAHLQYLDIETLRDWKKEGTKNKDIEGMTDFCSPQVLSEVLKSKSIFDKLKPDEMHKARMRSNPFETIGRGIFQNRAAMKMANIDAVFGFMFTNPVYENEEPMVENKGLLYFADVCAGPGGFSEYVLWRKKWRSKGFGFTLKGSNDFKLSDFFAGPCESFEPYYGVNDDGNVYDPENIKSLTKFVMDGTNGEGVHFMMADGGFSVEGEENFQEILSKRLYLTQFLVALNIVRSHGHFVCKLFDLFSPFSAGLIYLMYHAFKKICLFKPNTSRPANSERYIICKWKRDDCDSITEYLTELNDTLNELGESSKTDINFCVDMHELKRDKKFFKYLVKSNNELGRRQIFNLLKIAAFCHDNQLTEVRQADLRRQCLALWQVPDKVRKMDRLSPDDAVNKILSQKDKRLLQLPTKPARLLPDNMESSLCSVYDWNCIVMGGEEVKASIYLGLGRNQIFRWSGNRWIEEHKANFELSPGTMVFGEVVKEIIGEGQSLRKMQAFHIFDAVSLGYENVFTPHDHYNDRIEMCHLYESALRKRTNLCPIHVIKSVPLERITEIFERLTYRMNKGNSPQLVIEEDHYSYIPKGILFFNPTKLPWSRAISKTSGCYYYHSPHEKESKYEKDRPVEANASVYYCIKGHLVWTWEYGVGLLKEEPKPEVIHKDQLINFVRKRTCK